MSNVLSKPAVGLAAAVTASLSKKATAAAKKDIRRAAKPVTKPVKEAIHKARKWVDKATSKVPVLGKFAALPVDVVDDLAQGILLDKGKHKSGKFVPERLKWQVPELVDKLMPEVKTAKEMVIEPNPGPPKRNHKRKHKAKNAGKRRARKGMTLGQLMKRAKPVGRRRTKIKRLTFRNKKTGKKSSGMRMVSSEFMWQTTISNAATVGQEVLNGGLLINPHELKLPELNIEVQRWELYRIKPHIKLESISNGTVDCELFGYYDPDPTDTIPTDPVKRLQVAETHGGSPGYVSKGHSWTPNSKRVKATTVKWFYCDKNGTSNSDIRLADQYRFRLLIKRPPKLYGYTGGATGVSAGVDMVVNLRISYTIDFRNRTLDMVDAPTSGGMLPQIVSTTAGSFSTTKATGLVDSTVASFYSISSSFPFKRQFFLNNGGTNDVLYRAFNYNCPKYCMITLYAAASTLTGTMSLGSLVNCSATVTTRSATGSNANCTRILLTVTDTTLTQAGTLSTACTTLGAGYGHYSDIQYYAAGLGGVFYNWAMNFGNWTSVTTAGAFSMEICEFNEGNELAMLKLHGPATVEGQAFAEYQQLDLHTRPQWSQFLEKYRMRRIDREDELNYWKSKAQGKEYETKERKYHQAGLSLTPDNSDEEEYQEFLDYKKSVHKPTGLYMASKPLKIVQDDEKSEKGASRPKASSQK